MARNSTDPKDIETPYESVKLNISYNDALESWYGYFEAKYPMIGKVIVDKKND